MTRLALINFDCLLEYLWYIKVIISFNLYIWLDLLNKLIKKKIRITILTLYQDDMLVSVHLLWLNLILGPPIYNFWPPTDVTKPSNSLSVPLIQLSLAKFYCLFDFTAYIKWNRALNGLWCIGFENWVENGPDQLLKKSCAKLVQHCDQKNPSILFYFRLN